jgi:hypothetical protein
MSNFGSKTLTERDNCSIMRSFYARCAKDAYDYVYITVQIGALTGLAFLNICATQWK